MEDSLALVAAVAAVVASAVGGLLALGGVYVQERLAERRLERELAIREQQAAQLRRVERMIAIVRDTKSATDDIYTLLSTWSFGQDPEHLRQVRATVGPAPHPRADWLHVDNDRAMVEMYEVTREIVAKGRGSGDIEADSARLLAAYNSVVNGLIRQEDRLEDGVEDLPALGDEGQEAFMSWILLVERIRLQD